MNPGLACSEMPGSGQTTATPHSATGKLENPIMATVRMGSALKLLPVVSGTMQAVTILQTSFAMRVSHQGALFFYLMGVQSQTALAQSDVLVTSRWLSGPSGLTVCYIRA